MHPSTNINQQQNGINMITSDCKSEVIEFYHGSSSTANIESLLMAPDSTGVISEKGRNKNLNRVFFTKDIGLARIYAGRACRSYGGEPKLYRVICPVDVVCLDDRKGASVYHAEWAFAEELNNEKSTKKNRKQAKAA